MGVLNFIRSPLFERHARDKNPIVKPRLVISPSTNTETCAFEIAHMAHDPDPEFRDRRWGDFSFIAMHSGQVFVINSGAPRFEAGRDASNNPSVASRPHPRSVCPLRIRWVIATPASLAS